VLESIKAFTICGQQNGIVAEIELGNQLHANYAHGVDSILPVCGLLAWADA
jgi:hypothetical protein